MDKTPLVSVVVPVYNMEAFLPETLDSILASVYPNFVVVVVDDGSETASFLLAFIGEKKYHGYLCALSEGRMGACRRIL